MVSQCLVGFLYLSFPPATAQKNHLAGGILRQALSGSKSHGGTGHTGQNSEIHITMQDAQQPGM